jgi:hypothetical protein
MRTLSHLSFCSSLALALSLTRIVSSSSTCYTRELSIAGSDFFEEFNWESEDDPTHGRVNYLTLEEARAKNLVYADGDKFFMLPDSTNVVSPESRGRDSIRISSKRAFDESVVIIDLEHMPHGCGTWPAFWSLSQKGPWPRGGEIDIIEGVHEADQNLISLHTLPNCTMPQRRHQTGKTISTDCDTNSNFNQGCGTQVRRPGSYGKDFNSGGGGFYALARSKEYGIKVWFWPRGSLLVPLDVRWNGDTVNPDWWGIPTAYFPTKDNCGYEEHFDAHMFVFDLTFCGDWAGAPTVWPESGCSPMSCNDFVDQNPESFADAYWEVNSLRIYTPQAI